MSRKEQILQYVREHPEGVTSRQTADHFKLSVENISSRLRGLYAAGDLDRQLGGTTLTGREFHIYTLRAKEAAKNSVPPSTIKTRASTTRMRLRGPQVPIGIDGLLEQLAASITSNLLTRIQSNLNTQLTSLIPTAVTAPNLAQPQTSSALVTEPVDQVVAALPSPEEIKDRAPKTANKPTKPKVLVMGLLPNQEGQLVSEFHDALDLEFWNDRTGGRHQQLKSKAKYADMVFNHTAHSAHAYELVIKSIGTPYRRVPGGVTAMREALLNYYVEAK